MRESNAGVLSKLRSVTPTSSAVAILEIEMSKNRCRLMNCTVLALFLSVFVSADAQAEFDLQKGTPEIKHAGPMAFGPDGILLVGDSLSASVFAIDTEDTSSSSSPSEINIEGINRQIAGMIGTSTEDTLINDMVVNPLSGNIYLSISRGRGPDATPLIFKVNQKGQVEEFQLDNVAFASVAFENAPENGQDRRGRNPRMSAITDIQFDTDKVIVAGLSNEEFASKLRVFNFPFDGETSETSVEVYHGAHGKLETHSPVRTFITYENTVLAAYTCTPLVTIPVDDLKGDKIMGKTVAELGNRNQPLDMIIYKKGDQDYLLLSNSARGVMKMKISSRDLDSVDSIKSRVSGGGTAGLEYETMPQFEGVVQLDKLGAEHAVMLIASSTDSMDLKTVALP